MADAFFTPPRSFSHPEHDIAPTTIDGLIKLLQRAIEKMGK